MPEDDKDAQKLNELKNTKVKSAGYEAPRVFDVDNAAWQEQEQDIGYHNRYGADEAHGPLDSEEIKDMRYQNRFSRD